MVPKLRAGALRWRYGAAALAIFVPLAIPATASASIISALVPIGPPTQTFLNKATAITRTNGRTVFTVRFNFRESYASIVNPANRAKALADECADCDAIAIAVQVVFISTQDLTAINAENTADATDYLCDIGCSALAEAYQIVIATDSPTPTRKQILGLIRADGKFEALRHSGLDNTQIDNQATDIINQLVSTLEGSSGGASANALPTLSPAINGSALPAQLAENSGPVVNVYRDIQWGHPS